MPGPVHDTPAGHVAGTEDGVGVGQGREQRGEVLRGVRAVGVHLDDDLVLAGQRVPEAVEVGGAEAVLAGAVQDADPLVGGGEGVGELAGAVGAGVVDDEDVGVGQRGVQPRDGGTEVLPLVVGGNHDQDRARRFDHARPLPRPIGVDRTTLPVRTAPVRSPLVVLWPSAVVRTA